MFGPVLSHLSSSGDVCCPRTERRVCRRSTNLPRGGCPGDPCSAREFYWIQHSQEGRRFIDQCCFEESRSYHQDRCAEGDPREPDGASTGDITPDACGNTSASATHILPSSPPPYPTDNPRSYELSTTSPQPDLSTLLSASYTRFATTVSFIIAHIRYHPCLTSAALSPCHLTVRKHHGPFSLLAFSKPQALSTKNMTEVVLCGDMSSLLMSQTCSSMKLMCVE